MRLVLSTAGLSDWRCRLFRQAKAPQYAPERKWYDEREDEREGASDVVDLRTFVRTALRFLAPEAAVDCWRHLQSARRSTEDVANYSIPIQVFQLGRGLQIKGEGVVLPASSTAGRFLLLAMSWF